MLAVAVLGTLVFAPALSGPFVWDDIPLIENNPYVHSLRWFPHWFTHDFWDVNEEILRFGARIVYWRPLVTTTYATDWAIGDGSPLVFHISNLIFHAIVGVLAFVVLRRWVGQAWPAFAAALLFAVHPTKAESVAWIAGRTDILCMIAVLVATQGIARRLRGERGGLALEIAGTVMAYMCKEQAIVLPAFAAVEAWVALARPSIDRRVVVRMIRSALPQLAVAIAYLAIRAIVMPIGSVAKTGSLPLVDHAQIVLESIGRFVVLTFAPHDLSVQQGLIRVTAGRIVADTTYVVIGALAIVVLVAIAWFARRRWPFVTIGLGFYLATLFPTSNVKYTEMVTLISERFLYLPSFGIALVVGGVIAAFSERRRLAYLVVGALTLATAMQSLSRSVDYRDEHAFWERELALHPESNQARQFKIHAELRDRRFRAALVDILELDRRSTIRPPDFDLTIAMQVAETASALVPDRRVEDLRAIDKFLSDLIERRSGVAELNVLHVRFRYPLDTRAPRHGTMMPRLLVQRAALLGRLGDDATALELARRALTQCKECITIITMAALVHARAGQYEEAMALLDKGKRLVNEEAVAGAQSRIRDAWTRHNEALKSVGPAQLQKRAAELSALELWGRAYDVLAPHKEQIRNAPAFAPGFAELAFRAGDTAVAREILATYAPPDRIEPQLQEWSALMGWTD